MPDIKLEKVNSDDINRHGNLLQTGFWGELKSRFGWSPLYFIADGRPLLVLCRTLGAGRSLAYVPGGPDLPSTAGASLDEYWKYTAALARILKPLLPPGCIFLRFDPPWGMRLPSLGEGAGEYPGDKLKPSAAFTHASMDIQPVSTVILDLKEGSDAVMKGMKSKTRYNIRLAAKKGVEIRTSGIEALPKWYEIYRVTSERDKIALHNYEYYETFFKMSAEGAASGRAPELRLLEAVIDDRVEAGIVISFQGPPEDRRAVYLYGASSNEKRNYMPAYALQWEAIQQAVAAGCGSYDLFGIPPFNDPNHPMYGLYRFKTGFGGEILHRPGSWDYPFSRSVYTAYRAAEKLRNLYYRRLKKIGR